MRVKHIISGPLSKSVRIAAFCALSVILCHDIATAALPEDESGIKDQPSTISVKESFINLHTGPDKQLPTLDILTRADKVAFLRSQTDWFLVRAPSGYQGWARLSDFKETFQSASDPSIDPFLNLTTSADRFGELRRSYQNMRAYLSILGGDIDSDPMVGGKLGWRFGEKISTHFSWREGDGKSLNKTIYGFSLSWQPVRFGNISPYLEIGTSRLVQKRDELFDSTVQIEEPAFSAKAELSSLGLGLEFELSRRFSIDASLIKHYRLDSNKPLKGLQELQLGFSFYLGSEAGFLYSQLFANKLRDSSFSAGLFIGSYSSERFSSSQVSGLYLQYLVTDQTFFSLSYGSTNFKEPLSLEQGEVRIFANSASEIDLDYLSVGFGRSLFIREVVVGNDRQQLPWLAELYCLGGLGSTHLLGDNIFTLELGLGLAFKPQGQYRLFAEWREFNYRLKVINDDELTKNREFRLGLSRTL